MAYIILVFYGYEDWTLGPEQKCLYCGIGGMRRTNDMRRNGKHAHFARIYGLERRIVLETPDWEVAKQWEIAAIARNNTFYLDNKEFGCNFTRGGDGTVGYKPSTSELLKRAQSLKKAWNVPGRKERQSELQRKLWSSSEVRAHRAAIAREIRNDPAHQEMRKQRQSGKLARTKQAQTMRAKREEYNAPILQALAMGFTRQEVAQQLNVPIKDVVYAIEFERRKSRQRTRIDLSASVSRN